MACVFNTIQTLLIGFVLLFKLTVSGNETTTTDCECISQWSNIDIDCSLSTIQTLESYLTLNSINCLQTCTENSMCQQSFSLLTQYYNHCPLGYVSQDTMNTFNNNKSTCAHCKMETKYNNENLASCLHINCSETETLIDSTEYIALSCNDTQNECNTACQNNWHIISSYQRQCAANIFPLDYLYETDSFTPCQTDCNVEFNHNYVSNCSNSNPTKLNITELEMQTKLCFYGLNIEDPTIYDLICIEKHNLNVTGILSYNNISSDSNTSFWSSFGIAKDMDDMYLLICAAIVFFMQTGFTLLEGGAVKQGNVQNIMFKNILDCCICALTYWIVGHCVAYGNPNSPNANGFIGVENILIEDKKYADWFFQMAFACTASTIVSGAVAERFRLEPYFIYTIVVSSWIYPVVVHWVWSADGWLSPFNPNVQIYGGAIDFAGSACVHMIGGFLGLCGSYIVGPRFRRFDTTSKAALNSKYRNELKHQFEFGHNVPFQVMGVFFLWFAFFGFNAGSTLKANHSMDLASKIAVNTAISGAAGGLTCAFLTRAVKKTWHIPRLVNGLLAALASITAGCATVSPGLSIVIGFIGALLYVLASELIVRFEIDDVLDAFAVHGVGGLWGVLAAGLFSTSESLQFAQYPPSLYNDTTVGQRFATNLLLIVVVIAWTMVHGIVLFGFMGERFLNILRVDEKHERSGMDVSEHGGHGYNMIPTK